MRGRRVARIACVQMRSIPDARANLDSVLRAIHDAKRLHGESLSLVSFPENSLFLSVPDARTMAPLLGGLPWTFKEDSESSSSALKEVLEAARREKVAVLLPLLERDEDNRIYNSALWIDSEGVIQHRYRKVHLFDYGALAESKTITGGTELCAFDSKTSPSFLAALTICFDLRFPHMFQEYASMGAEVVFVPSAFTLETGKAHWLALLRARAIEGQCYIVAPAQWGVHSETRASHGESCIIDPWGTVIALASNQEGIIAADLDFDYLQEIRQKMPVQLMRKQVSSKK